MDGAALCCLCIESVRPCTPIRVVLAHWIRGYLHAVEPAQTPPAHVLIDWTRVAYLACSWQRLQSIETWDRDPLRRRFPGCVAVILYELDRASSSVAIYGFLSLTNSKRAFSRDPFLEASDVRLAPQPHAEAPFLTLESSKTNAYCDPLFRTARIDPAFEGQTIAITLAYVAELTADAHVPDMQAGRVLLLKKYTREGLCAMADMIGVGKLNYYLRFALLCVAYTGDGGQMHAPAIGLGCAALAALISGLVSIIHPTEDSVAQVVSLLGLPLQLVGLDPTLDFALCSARDSPGQYYFPFGHAPSVEKLRRAYAAALGQTSVPHKNWATNQNTAGMFLAAAGISFAEMCIHEKRFKRTEPNRPIAVLYDAWPISFYCHIRTEHATRTLQSLLSYLAFCGANFTAQSRVNWACCELGARQSGWSMLCLQDIIFLRGKPELDAFIEDWRQRCSFDIEILPGLGSTIPCESTNFVPHLHPSTLAMPKQNTFGELVCELLATEPPAVREAVGKARELAQRLEQPAPSYLLHDPATGHYFSPHALGQWVGERTVADVLAVRAVVWEQHRGNKKQFMKKHYLGGALADLYKPLSNQLTEPLLRQLTSVIAEKARAAIARATPPLAPLRRFSTQGFSGSRRSFFDMQPFRSIEEGLAKDMARVQSYLMYLTGASRIGSASHGTGLEATSETHKITYTMASAPKYATSWKDWKDPTSAAKGWRLGSLTKYVKQFATEQEAVLFLTEWASGHATASKAALPSHPSSPEMSATAVRTAMEYVTEHKRTARNSSRVLVGTVANTYLRKTRGLGLAEEGGAPHSLIEQNPFVVARRAVHFGEERRPCVSVFTGTYQIIQNTCLNEETSNKDLSFGYPKKSYGVFDLQDGTKDNVPLQIVPDTARYLFAAEGLETGLSFACALSRANVCALLGVGNIEGLHREAGVSVAIWCRENDKKKEDPRDQAAAEAAIARRLKILADRFEQVLCVFPPPEYNDFNDVHREHNGAAGTRIIIECLRAQLPQDIFDAVK